MAEHEFPGSRRPPAIKVCGLTRVEEVAMLARWQIDYAGMVLYFPKSKRNLSLAQAERILQALPPEIAPVAVTVSPTREQLKGIEALPFRYLQVHGTLAEEVLRESRIPIFRAYNLSGAKIERESHARIAGYVLDAAGYGSGQTFDWTQRLDFDCEGKLFLLAGGLTPDNVAEGIRCFHPDVVDVSSGVEGENGKDEEKIRRFAEAVRGAALR